MMIAVTKSKVAITKTKEENITYIVYITTIIIYSKVESAFVRFEMIKP